MTHTTTTCTVCSNTRAPGIAPQPTECWLKIVRYWTGPNDKIPRGIKDFCSEACLRKWILETTIEPNEPNS